MNVTVELPAELLRQLVEEVTARVLEELRAQPARRLVTVAEAAKALGLTEHAVRKHEARGHLPAVRVGSRILIDLGATYEGETR